MSDDTSRELNMVPREFIVIGTRMFRFTDAREISLETNGVRMYYEGGDSQLVFCGTDEENEVVYESIAERLGLVFILRSGDESEGDEAYKWN